MDAKEFVPGAEILLETENTEAGDDSDNSDEEWVNVSQSEDENDNDEDVLEDAEDEEIDGQQDDDNDEDEESTSDKEVLNETDHSNCTQKSLAIDKTTPTKKVVTKQQQLIEKKEKAVEVSSMRILTDEDFKRIEIAQLNKQMTTARNRKRPAEPNTTSK